MTSMMARKAYVAVRRALRRGAILRGPCEICGIQHRQDGAIIDGHHEAYDQPLDVTWLCRRHHRQIHADIRAGVWVKTAPDPTGGMAANESKGAARYRRETEKRISTNGDF